MVTATLRKLEYNVIELPFTEVSATSTTLHLTATKAQLRKRAFTFQHAVAILTTRQPTAARLPAAPAAPSPRMCNATRPSQD
eukprot:5569699-Amphidinium_carterae.1